MEWSACEDDITKPYPWCARTMALGETIMGHSYRPNWSPQRDHIPSIIVLEHKNFYPNDYKGSQLHSRLTALHKSLLTNSEFIISLSLYIENAPNKGNTFQIKFHFTLIPPYTNFGVWVLTLQVHPTPLYRKLWFTVTTASQLIYVSWIEQELNSCLKTSCFKR